METNNEYLLAAKLAAKKSKVCISVNGIKKTGKNTFQNYHYAEEAEVVKWIRKALSDNGLAFSVAATDYKESHDIATKSGSMKHFVLSLICKFTDTETGYSESCQWFGGAADSGDKALYKAYTSGVKYFLLKTFLLPTGDDVEAFDTDGEPEPEANPEPKKAAPKPAAKPAVPPQAANPKKLFKEALANRAAELNVMLPDEKNPTYKEFVYHVIRELCKTEWKDDPTMDPQAIIDGKQDFCYQDLANRLSSYNLQFASMTFGTPGKVA